MVNTFGVYIYILFASPLLRETLVSFCLLDFLILALYFWPGIYLGVHVPLPPLLDLIQVPVLPDL